MSNTKSGPWIAGTVIVALLISIAGWFLLISPVMATAAETSTQAVAQQDTNDVTRAQLVTLKKQFAELDSYKAELAALQLEIPPKTAMADFQRQVAAVAAAHSVTVMSVVASPGVPVVPVVPAGTPAEGSAAEAPSSEEGAAPAEGAEGADPAAAAAPSGPELLTGFYQLPVSIEVIGSYANIEAFLSDLQTTTQRLFFVNGLTGTSTPEAEASGGRPATVPGDLDLVVTGSAYVLQEPPVPPAPVDPNAVPPAPPVPPGDKNPLTPVGS